LHPSEAPLSQPLVNRIPFAKIVTVLAIVFGVALGTCGVTFVVGLATDGSANRALSSVVGVLAPVELIVLALSAIGLVFTLAAWVILTITANVTRRANEPQRIFDDRDGDDKKGSS
jgi:cytochrome bd-type quinol oxidase subunit 2